MNAWLSKNMIAAVCRTFGSDMEASADLIRQVISADSLADRGYYELPRLTDEIKPLMGFDPVLVEDIYAAAFSFTERSQERTAMFGSAILPLTSTRSQDYSMALYHLAEAFDEYLQVNHVSAIRTLVAVSERYVRSRHTWRNEGEAFDEFEFDGLPVKLRIDFSYVWDDGVYGQDEPMKMLATFVGYLKRIGHESSDESLRNSVLREATKSSEPIIWRRLLAIAAEMPATWGLSLKSLLWASPVLYNISTTYPVGEYLKAIFTMFEPAEREAIERAILEFQPAGPYESEHLDDDRYRLVRCLEESSIVLPETRQLREAYFPNDESTPNNPMGEINDIEGPDPDIRSGTGVHDTSIPEVTRTPEDIAGALWTFAQSVKTSSEESRPSEVPWTEIQGLSKMLMQDEYPSSPLWGELAAACVAAIGVAEPTTSLEFLEDVLLEASTHPEPIFNPDQDRQFDDHPSWGSPLARIEAAQGLILLSQKCNVPSQQLLGALDRLATDEVAAVRYQIVSAINVLYEKAPDTLGLIASRSASSETNQGVIWGLMMPLWKLRFAKLEFVSELVDTIYHRLAQLENSTRTRHECAKLFADLYVRFNEPRSAARLAEFEESLVDRTEETSIAVSQLRTALTIGSVTTPDERSEEIRGRALSITSSFIAKALAAFENIINSHDGIQYSQWTAPEQASFHSVWQAGHSMGMEIYFASGAQERGNANLNEHLSEEDAARFARFMREMRPALDDLAEFGHPRLAYELLKMYEYFISVDPREVFLSIARVVRRASEIGGLHNESMAADLLVKVVTRYLADYPVLLRSDDVCRKGLLEILDLFVRAGWPQAMRLTYRLDEIFR